ncbi:hypothetical protein SAMN02745975_03414 [Geosporobacter subterraneus DSM 17957]|uniref:Uncharacterized protein n=1 Tax=Geosporobacter subterraneus DSM 17957 TaxID=1121919 RepID=A0A1M6NVT3_9FIRM|nr:hypothetical protein [Geosporobacter subterraneus]SHJ99751.1 hypothetical protein SAMN02745975_03414 [Geosporobacter subterraneus DSM 17957]
MKGEKAAVGILIVIMVIVLGGAVGIFGGYYLSRGASAESTQQAAENSEVEAAAEPQEGVKEDTTTPAVEEAIVEKPFLIPETEEVEVFIETWGTLIEKTCNGSIDQKKASQLVYQLASEVYRRNIPEGYGPLRIKGIMDKGLGAFEAIQFSEPIYEGKEYAMVDVTEIYANGNNRYRLKLVKENNQWRFSAQLSL